MVAETMYVHLFDFEGVKRLKPDRSLSLARNILDTSPFPSDVWLAMEILGLLSVRELL